MRQELNLLPFFISIDKQKLEDMMKLKLLFTVLFLSFLANTKAQNLYFPPVVGSTWDTLSPTSLNWCPARIDSLYNFLDTNNTKAFIILKDGKIVLEKYFGTQTQTSSWYWASAGKTLTSFMVGIAQQEGHLSISDTTSQYLGQGWTSCTPAQEQKITIRHELTMTTGLDDGVPNEGCMQDTCLIYKSDAGTRWAYHNAPYTLLDSVIYYSTGLTLNTYMNQKLKQPIGMTGTFSYVDNNNVFFSTARSMARFGLLILNKGKWNNTPVMTDTSYYKSMVNTSQSLNKSYGYLWWLNGKESYMIPNSQLVFPGKLLPNAPDDMIAAMGKNGQFLNIIPSQKIVMIRMGEAPDAADVPFLLNDQIWAHLNALPCAVTAAKPVQSKPKVMVYPNPAADFLTVKSDKNLQKIEIWSIDGKIMQSLQVADQQEININTNKLKTGLYLLKITDVNGGLVVQKIEKQ
ncbi:Por secretion system C-terminal sorting domain-containing protein [Flexibacter flexilis DSM 6793]|uniref:Por secretion system C-terminal sorting domain-containing protein n=2 Tax=Flexibacter flexilis TaxID=998 RepID=A0A1I1HET8_9BACT|nr:Por secretion system C-terminal sorting domain-containing protein [Flexibacter flexilis DSM 6793]